MRIVFFRDKKLEETLSFFVKHLCITLFLYTDNDKILNLLGINNNKKVVACMVIGYPNVKYKRTAPRKDANISWI